MKATGIAILLSLLLVLGMVPAAAGAESGSDGKTGPAQTMSGTTQQQPVRLKVSTGKSGKQTLVKITAASQENDFSGRVLCAAYDSGTGRMLAFNCADLKLQAGEEKTVTLELNAPELARYRIYLVDEKNCPVAEAVSPLEKGIGGDNETEIVRTARNRREQVQ